MSRSTTRWSLGRLGSSVTGSVATSSRLRPALYFICVLMITTLLYCMVLQEPDYRASYRAPMIASLHNRHGLLLHNHRDGRPPEPGDDAKSPEEVPSRMALLDELMLIANHQYRDRFRSHVPMVPEDEIIINDNNNNNNNNNDNNNGRRGKSGSEERQRLPPLGNDSLRRSRDLEDQQQQQEWSQMERLLRLLGFDLDHLGELYYSLNGTKLSSIMAMFQDKDTKDKDNTDDDGDDNNNTNNNHNHNHNGLEDNNTNKHHVHQRNQYQNRFKLLAKRYHGSMVFVTGVNADQAQLGTDFIRAFDDFRSATLKRTASSLSSSSSRFTLMVYDLGLYAHQLTEIESLCNASWSPHQPLCEVRHFDYTLYPSHVSDLKLGSYRAVILQEMLRDLHRLAKVLNTTDQAHEAITLFWLDPHLHLIAGHDGEVVRLAKVTRATSGVFSWTIEQPTSALTHPRMFDYFRVPAESFYFHRMVQPSQLLIATSSNTWQPVQWGLMLPWVRCALAEECVAPLGSQWRSRCGWDKKPHYRYTGCHHYAMSALNLVLGIGFDYSSTGYTSRAQPKPFGAFHQTVPAATTTSPSPPLLEEQASRTLERVPVEGRMDQLVTDDDIPPPPPPTLSHPSSSV